DRQERIGDHADERERGHHQRRGDRAPDEWFGDIHERHRACAVGGGLMLTGAPRRSLYCPPVTTRPPALSPDVAIPRSFLASPTWMGRGSAVSLAVRTHANSPCGPR